MISPFLRIVLQCAQPLEDLFIGAVSDLAEQVVGAFFETQQVVHIHQYFLSLFVFGLFQLVFESVEGEDTVRVSLGDTKWLLEFDVLFQVFVHRNTIRSIPPEVPDGGLLQHIC